MHTLCAFMFFVFGHQVDIKGLIPLISVPQSFRNRLEDVANLYNTVFL